MKKDLTRRQAVAKLKTLTNGKMFTLTRAGYYYTDGEVYDEYHVYVDGVGGYFESSWYGVINLITEVLK